MSATAHHHPPQHQGQPGSGTPGEPMLYHHFDDLEQQHFSSMLGMWAFLATEVLFFGGLFLAYTVYRTMYKPAFVAAGQHLNVLAGGINTAVLLVSSLTMALAVRSSQLGEPRRVVRYLLVTMALGTAFLGIKAYEWITDYHEGLVPGIAWDWDRAEAHKRGHVEGTGAHGPEATTDPHGETAAGKSPSPSASERRARLSERYRDAEASQAEAVAPLISPGGEAIGEMPVTVDPGRAQLFFLLYFFMTGLHAFHMIVGLVLVGLMAYLVHSRWLTGGGPTQIEVTGLYWHFIDIVWVFLYPILYLIDIHQ